jgi:hypothetical protein
MTCASSKVNACQQTDMRKGTATLMAEFVSPVRSAI